MHIQTCKYRRIVAIRFQTFVEVKSPFVQDIRPL